MTYKITIEGMHCSGCENLIKMSLEEIGFSNITISLKDNLATFDSLENLEAVKNILDSTFSNFDKYKYLNLVVA